MASEGVQFRQRRPAFDRLDGQVAESRQAFQGRDRVDPAVEAVSRRRIADREHRLGRRRWPPGPQAVDPGLVRRRGRGIGGWGPALEPSHDGVGRRIGVDRRIAARFPCVEPLNHLVKAGQTIADQSRCDVDRAGARRCEDILRGMQGSSHRLEIHDPGGALEGVEGAERAVDPIGGIGPFLQHQQVVSRLFDQLSRLD